MHEDLLGVGREPLLGELRYGSDALLIDGGFFAFTLDKAANITIFLLLMV